MREILVKTAFYSFIFSFLLFWFFTDRSIITTDVNGYYSSMQRTYQEYFTTLFIYSFGITITMIMAVYFTRKGKGFPS